ncbi:Adenine phosphoribosyltransferase 2 [Zea mays]|uniref:adenine phosphoribosyltransferase n=1 Tax=Zea mays TaxID=4577 RepID=A0A1D6Q4W2_MAIZE|nr:Adenine phosphoribosyltransferase 2 [Zea mays]
MCVCACIMRAPLGGLRSGIMFNDITTLLLRPRVFKDAVDLFVERYRGMGIDAVAGIEARGFVFGPAIALAIGAKFIPLRKPRKLPGERFHDHACSVFLLLLNPSPHSALYPAVAFVDLVPSLWRHPDQVYV